MKKLLEKIKAFKGKFKYVSIDYSDGEYDSLVSPQYGIALVKAPSYTQLIINIKLREFSLQKDK
jgi:hypothetical protein